MDGMDPVEGQGIPHTPQIQSGWTQYQYQSTYMDGMYGYSQGSARLNFSIKGEELNIIHSIYNLSQI